jgi:hypothetical protein
MAVPVVSSVDWDQVFADHNSFYQASLISDGPATGGAETGCAGVPPCAADAPISLSTGRAILVEELLWFEQHLGPLPLTSSGLADFPLIQLLLDLQPVSLPPMSGTCGKPRKQTSKYALL